jgi:lysozyme
MAKAPTHDTPWTAEDALAFLRELKSSGTTEWEGLCMRLAARSYGYNTSGYDDPVDYWGKAKSGFKHPGDRKPPVGGVTIFLPAPGVDRHGHIAVTVKSDGDDVLVLANDDTASGRVRPLTIGAIESGLTLRYAGWVEPHFPLSSLPSPSRLPAGDAPRKVFLQALSLGTANSASVRMLQHRLRAVLDIDLAVTGTYDEPTRKAVARFQSRCCRFGGDGADGRMWDPATKSGGAVTAARLFPASRFDVRRGAVPASDLEVIGGADGHEQPDNGGLTDPGAVMDPDVPVPERPRVDLAQLVPGSKNASVRRLQRRLNHVAKAGLAVTGRYDDETVKAVRAWQTSIGDAGAADGVLGPKQFARLFPQRAFKRAGAPPAGLTLSHRGEDFIVEFEGFSSKLYNDQAGHCTIGVGHLVHLGNCRKTEGGLEKGITRAKAVALMRRDAASFIDSVASNVKVPLTQEQFDALVSFAFNVGAGNFETSTLLEKLNAGHPEQVPAQLKRWNKVTVNGQKVASKGLTRRRGREARLFSDAVYTA